MRLRLIFARLLLPAALVAACERPAIASDPENLPFEEAGYCEVQSMAHAVGVDYTAITARAARGDINALRSLLRFTTAHSLNEKDDISGVAAWTHQVVLARLLRRVGDAKFAAALNQESPRMRAAISND